MSMMYDRPESYVRCNECQKIVSKSKITDGGICINCEMKELKDKLNDVMNLPLIKLLMLFHNRKY